ncbi:hypothetical protein [Sphingobium cupriresistens]|nr:hypothetical protein [Sphingobium cupriresistens]
MAANPAEKIIVRFNDGVASGDLTARAEVAYGSKIPVSRYFA